MTRKEKISKLMFLIEEYANAVSDWENAHGCEDGDIDINRAMKKMADTHTELQMYVNEIM